MSARTAKPTGFTLRAESELNDAQYSALRYLNGAQRERNIDARTGAALVRHGLADKTPGPFGYQGGGGWYVITPAGIAFLAENGLPCNANRPRRA